MIYDAVIIGAGPAGSSLASALASRGWQVLLLEQRRQIGHKVCGEFISWEAQASLRALGLQAELRAAGPAGLRRAVLTSRTGLSAGFDLPGASWGLSRQALDQTLASAAQHAGAELSLGTRAMRFEHHPSGCALELRQRGRSREIECRALIAACGRSSAAGLPPTASDALHAATNTTPPYRRSDGVSDAEPRSLPSRPARVGIKQHYRNLQMPSQVELYFFDGGYVGLAPVEDGMTNLCMLASRAALEAADRDPVRLIDTLAERIPGIGRRLKGAVPLHPAPLAAAPVDLWRRAEPWDRIACVGDAAAMIPPLAGDGIAAALRSAELCAPLADACLRGELSLEQWEHAYRQQWHAAFDRPLALARRLESLLGTGFGSNLLLGLGWLLPALTQRLARMTRGRPPAPALARRS